jgi:hypothetical protein
MSKVRVLVGTKKGAFILTADGKRDRWEVNGPHFAGWEIYHVKGSPTESDRLYASQTSGWFGQVIQRSDNGGKTWETAGNEFNYDGVPGTHQWYDGTQHPWEFKRVWHLEPSERSEYRLRGSGGRSAVQDCGRRPHLAGASRIAQRQGPPLAARGGRDVSAHDHPRSQSTQPNFHCDLCGWRLPH